MDNVVNSLMNRLTDDQKEQLLVSFISAERTKKVNEINKNYKDEAKRTFAHSNIENTLMDRLLKKLNETLTKQEIANQVESLESLL